MPDARLERTRRAYLDRERMTLYRALMNDPTWRPPHENDAARLMHRSMLMQQAHHGWNVIEGEPDAESE